ncbi:MAG: amino acid ABC transporter permease, partial [Cyanobacteria bacterium P01_G01_bin.4]
MHLFAPDESFQSHKPMQNQQPIPRPRNLLTSVFNRIPLWLVLLVGLAIVVCIQVLGSPDSRDILTVLSRGLVLTLKISVTSYVLALAIGFIAGLGRVSSNPVIQAIATLYVEVMRGIPILVVLLYTAFVIAPGLSKAIDTLAPAAEDPQGLTALMAGVIDGLKGVLRSNFWRATIALAISYGAYLAEIYRSGIEAIASGQREAARALGLSQFQTTTLIVMPQAFRIILPPLGNDFIALIKDSSLASVIGLAELTHQTRFLVSRSFDTFGGWSIAALLYLSITLV